MTSPPEMRKTRLPGRVSSSNLSQHQLDSRFAHQTQCTSRHQPVSAFLDPIYRDVFRLTILYSISFASVSEDDIRRLAPRVADLLDRGVSVSMWLGGRSREVAALYRRPPSGQASMWQVVE